LLLSTRSAAWGLTAVQSPLLKAGRALCVGCTARSREPDVLGALVRKILQHKTVVQKTANKTSFIQE